MRLRVGPNGPHAAGAFLDERHWIGNGVGERMLIEQTRTDLMERTRTDLERLRLQLGPLDCRSDMCKSTSHVFICVRR